MGPFIKGTSTTAVVFLHGYGADGNDLLPIGEEWKEDLKGAFFFSPHAPYPCEGNPYGRQWTSLRDFDPIRLQKELENVAPLLVSYLKTIQDQYKLEKIFLMGFSQGAFLSLEVGLYHMQVAGVLAYSGSFVHPAPPAPCFKPPILLVHGAEDEVVPLSYCRLTEKKLHQLGIPFEKSIEPHLQHSISQEGLDRGKNFILSHL